MKSTACLFALITGMVINTAPASAAIFQYALPVKTTKGERKAFLWIPPKADYVRGLVVAGETLAEREIVVDPRIRHVCADEQLGIVFFKAGLSTVDIWQALERFAEVSGYVEIPGAPMLFIGHSAGGPQARLVAREFSDRCFGLVQYRGGDPGDFDHDFRQPLPYNIPALMMVGQFDEFGKIGRDENGVENWEKDRDKLARYRARQDVNLDNVNVFASMVVEPGGGHFGYSPRSSRYLALFIQKAAKARIPPAAKTNPLEARPEFLAIDYASGWVTDLTIRPPLVFRATPANSYDGKAINAAWHLDWEMAAATEAYHAGFDKEDQFIKWVDSHRVEAGARNIFSDPHWIDEGQTFMVTPAFARHYPRSGAKWGKAGDKVSNAGTDIELVKIGGPIVKSPWQGSMFHDRAFRIQFDELCPATEDTRITFLAFNRGNDQFRYTEHVGMLPSGSSKVTKGATQKITRFDPIADMSVGSQPIDLVAETDLRMPVEFHIGHGPARIVDGKLSIAEIPQRTKYPIEVTVVAYQFGRAIEPKIQSAEPVVRTFKIVK